MLSLLRNSHLTFIRTILHLFRQFNFVPLQLDLFHIIALQDLIITRLSVHVYVYMYFYLTIKQIFINVRSVTLNS